MSQICCAAVWRGMHRSIADLLYTSSSIRTLGCISHQGEVT